MNDEERARSALARCGGDPHRAIAYALRRERTAIVNLVSWCPGDLLEDAIRERSDGEGRTWDYARSLVLDNRQQGVSDE